jgi:hypothetical protein
VDSTYSGYSTAPIDDGVINANGGTSTTWASNDDAAQPHWIAITFPSQTQINNVNVWWAYNSGQARLMTSQRLDVQYWDGSAYQTATSLVYAADVANSSASFPAVSTTSLRFYQPANMGPPSYPRVLWVTELDYGLSGSVCVHRSDIPPCDGCVRDPEMLAFIARWKVNSSEVTLKELMESIGFWKKGGC